MDQDSDEDDENDEDRNSNNATTFLAPARFTFHPGKGIPGNSAAVAPKEVKEGQQHPARFPSKLESSKVV